MIYDSFKNLESYKAVLPHADEIIKFFATTDVSKLPGGRTDIADGVFLNRTLGSQPKDKELTFPEKHEKFMDIQFVTRGQELLGVCDTEEKLTIKAQDIEGGDYTLYNEPMKSWVLLKEGMFCALYPRDIHQPNVKYCEGTTDKCVLKVRMD